jgi:hypothetical protein
MAAGPAYQRLIERNRDLEEVALGSKIGAKARWFALDHPRYLLTVAFHNSLRLFNLGGASYERTVARSTTGSETARRSS